MIITKVVSVLVFFFMEEGSLWESAFLKNLHLVKTKHFFKIIMFKKTYKRSVDVYKKKSFLIVSIMLQRYKPSYSFNKKEAVSYFSYICGVLLTCI